MKNVQSSHFRRKKKRSFLQSERNVHLNMNVLSLFACYSKLTIHFEISAKGQFQSKNVPNA